MSDDEVLDEVVAHVEKKAKRLNKLDGLVVVDFEFGTEEEKLAFEMPDFCLVEVTQEEFIAGGMLAGKSYEDIKEKLEEFGYSKHQF